MLNKKSVFFAAAAAVMLIRGLSRSRKRDGPRAVLENVAYDTEIEIATAAGTWTWGTFVRCTKNACVIRPIATYDSLRAIKRNVYASYSCMDVRFEDIKQVVIDGRVFVFGISEGSSVERED